MTTIAWRGNQLVADRLCSYHASRVEKLRMDPMGRLIVGGSGSNAGLVASAIDWYLHDQRKPDLDGGSVEVLLIDSDGTHPRFATGLQVPTRVNGEFFAIGSGADYAMGAMAMGASAEEAVRIAARYDLNTGGGLTVVELSQERPPLWFEYDT